MRKIAAIAAMGVGLGVVGLPQGAQASPVSSCTTGALQVCAAFDASTMFVSDGMGGGSWHLILKVWNLYDGSAANGVSHVITFAGIGSSWSGTATLASATYNGSAIDWISANQINNNVVGAQLDFAAHTDNGVNQGLIGCNQPVSPGAYATCFPGGPELVLDFVTSSEFTLAGAVEGWHSQSIDGTSCSLWADTDGNSTASDLGACTGSVVPEPMTMFLVGTGLACVGGVGFLRRRNGYDVGNA